MKRADCKTAARPCRRIGCRYHLQHDVDRFGRQIRYWDRIEDMPETCALDVAERGGVTLRELGVLMNRTMQAVQVLESRLMPKLRAHPGLRAVAADAAGEDIERTIRRLTG